MDSIWTALEGAKPCRIETFDGEMTNKDQLKKKLDWMTM